MILHAIAGLERAAGTSVFCAELCKHLTCLDWDPVIVMPKQAHRDAYPVDSDVPVQRFSSGVSSVQLAHIHGLWNPFLHRVSASAYARGVPVVISPHGMLTPWALRNRALKKLVFMRLYQQSDLSRATMFHATSREEVEDIRRLGYRQPIIVAPLGVSLSTDDRRLHQAVEQKRGPRTVLFLSRIHPKKGLDMLLDAWARLKHEAPALVAPESGRRWRIVLAGPDEGGHASDLLARAAGLGISARRMPVTQAFAPESETEVAFVGPVFDAEKSSLLKESDLFVLPSHSENFGVVVVEALACRLPVITTVGTPWRELEDVGRSTGCGRAGWCVDVSISGLVGGLTQAMSLSDADRSAIGEAGRWLVENRYSWASVARIVSAAYRWLLEEEDAPPEVCLD